MPQFLLSVFNDGSSPYSSDEEMQQAFADVGAVNAEMQAAGAFVFAGGLQFPDTARVSRVQDGAVVRADGPYLEATEHIGGFWILEVDDLAAAQAWADKATVACRGAVEVRPFQTI